MNEQIKPLPLHRACYAGLVALLVLTAPPSASAASLSGTFTSLAAGTNINLSVVGAVDWMHWGRFTEFAYDRKAGAATLITNYTTVGVLDPYVDGPFRRPDDLATGFSWNDGSQNSFVTNTHGGIYILGRDYGFRITVPADTTTRVLRVYLGTQARVGTLTATLSDGSASASPVNLSAPAEGVYTITYAAGSANRMLTVTWVGTGNGNPAPSVTLSAVALANVSANNPPTATLTSPALNANLSATGTHTLQAIASDPDGTVSLVEFFTGTNKIGQATGSPYTVSWTNPPPGLHPLTVKATDNSGGTGTSKPVEVFVHTSGGSLTGSGAAPAASINLSTEGTNDWAHWGLSSAASFDHKNGVTMQISNFTTIGPIAAERYADDPTVLYSWTGGTPTASASSTPSGVYVLGLTNGFQLTLPASAQPRTVKVYAALYAARANFRAFLSDFSAPAFSDTTFNSEYSNGSKVYTLTYASAADRTLIIRHTGLNSHDATFGSVALQAATLSVGVAPLSPFIIITNTVKAPASFSFSFLSDAGPAYEVQYTGALPASNWLLYTNLVGNGGLLTVTAPGTLGGTNRFYRVRRP